ncbi:tlde1 domain-containing protein, partial [Aliikangiella maris]
VKEVGPKDVFSGKGKDMNDPSRTDNKNTGPIPPGKYEMEWSAKYGGSYWLKEGWLAAQLCSRLGWGRCEFFLHKGNDSDGCITVDPDNSEAMKQFNDLMDMLSKESKNTMEVTP